MLYLIHRSQDRSAVDEKLVPLLGDGSFKLIPFPLENFEPNEESLLLLYLGDADLKTLFIQAIKLKWVLAILPHPENKYASKGLGITGSLSAVFTNILETNNSQKLDVLLCNGRPVFQSVNIGSIFLLKKEEKPRNFVVQFLDIFRSIQKAYSLQHKTLILKIDQNKILHTSAMGLTVVEHPKGSIISNRLAQESSVRDGTFYAFVLSPENLLSLFLFLLRSMWPRKKNLEKLPSFIGELKTSNLQIEGDTPIHYISDGEESTADELCLEIEKQAILLHQKTAYSDIPTESNGRKSLKVEGLPTGEKRDELSKRRIPALPRATTEEFEDLFKVLRKNATITAPFIIMMVLSTLIASFGLFGNSSPVIIGAMILAPIIAPVVSFAMGMVRYDTQMLKRGIGTILSGTIVSLACAALVSIIIPMENITGEIEARLSPNLLDLGIAVASGVAAAYAHAEKGIAKSLAGVAIAVALVPPLSVAGIGIGWMDWNVFSGAFLLYLTNLAGIILLAGLTFLVLGFAPFRTAKMGLVYTLIIVILVAVPLSLSFNRIKKEARITRALEGTTIEKVVLRDVHIRYGEPLVVSLKLVGTEKMDPATIRSIKGKIERKINEPIILEVVSALEL